MATKTAKTATEKKPRNRRTPEQMIADHEAEIARIKARAAAREAKAAPEGKPFLTAVKAVDKAIVAARETENEEMLRALESARATLAEQLIRMGVRAPETRRGRRPKSAA